MVAWLQGVIYAARSSQPMHCEIGNAQIIQRLLLQPNEGSTSNRDADQTSVLSKIQPIDQARPFRIAVFTFHVCQTIGFERSVSNCERLIYVALQTDKTE